MSALSDFYNNFDRFVNGRLEDRLYTALSAVDEFNRLSMDRQGEIVVELAKEMSTFSEEGSDPILKKDEWDIENEKVGC